MRSMMSSRLGRMLLLLMLLTVAVGGAGLWFVRGLANEIRTLNDQNLQAATHLSNTERDLWELRFALPNYFLADADSRKGIDASTGKITRELESNIASYAALSISSREQELLREWRDHFSRYLSARPHYFALISAGKLNEALEFRARETNPPAADCVRILTALIELQQQLGNERAKRAEAEALMATRILVGVLLLALLIGGMVSRSLAADVTSALHSAIQHMQASSDELQAAAGQQAAGAKEQASAVSEVSTTLKELVSTARQIGESAQRVAQLAEESRLVAKGGDVTGSRAQEAVSATKRQVDLIVHHMLDLGKKSQQIGGVLDIINELSEQTNILSINATIEASGAGESGARFSAVAEEIRKLADRTAGSTKEIRALVEEIRSGVNTTVMVTEGGSKAADAAAKQITEVAVAFGKIAQSVVVTTQAAQEIELSTKQQASAVEQVNAAVAGVAQAAKDSEVSTGQTLQTSSQLAALSRDLNRLVRPDATH
jgi:hypothetical protein